MEQQPDKLTDKLEPIVSTGSWTAYDHEMALASAAVSLKRIADNLDRLTAAVERLPDSVQLAVIEAANSAIYAWRQR